MARKSPSGGAGRYTFDGMNHSPRAWATNAPRTASSAAAGSRAASMLAAARNGTLTGEDHGSGRHHLRRRAERVPQMAGAEEVVAGIDRRDGVAYSGLVLNEKGYERFAATGLDELHFTLAATEAFNQRNANRSVDEPVEELTRMRTDSPVSVSISVSFGCPFEGEVDPQRVLRLAERVTEAGADEVLFADTIGVGVPRQVRELLGGATGLGVPVGLHLHDTRNTALANAYAALEAGATVFEASVGGLGGCPC